MTTPPAMPEVSPKDLEAVLRRSKENDALAVKIAQAIELINGVLDHLSWVASSQSWQYVDNLLGKQRSLCHSTEARTVCSMGLLLASAADLLQVLSCCTS
jgi:hypothetical protein